MKALVIGGTGPTGPFIVQGLLQRDYTVAILHRGTHEIAEIPPEVEHIHTDPHFLETLNTALTGPEQKYLAVPVDSPVKIRDRPSSSRSQ